MGLATNAVVLPNGAHQTIDEEFVFFRRCLLPSIPDLAVTPLHKPALEINGVA